MFNRKLISGFLTTLAVLLALKELILIIMFIWSFFATPIFPIFNGAGAPLDSVFILVQETGLILFQYAFVAVLAYATAKLAPASAPRRSKKK